MEKYKLPGLWIDHPDRGWASLAQRFLVEILDQLNEAHLVLILFEQNSKSALSVDANDRRLVLIYAKSFVYALDAIGQLIRILQDQEQLPLSAKDSCENYLNRFGELRDLRNSLQHIEDRLRGLGRNNKPIPNPLLILGGLRDNKFFGATTANGTYLEIEISASIIAQAYAIIENLIWCFKWLGPGNSQIERFP